MPEERIMKVLLPLMLQLSKAKSLAASYSTDGASSSIVDEIFGTIEEEVQFIKEVMLGLERWERDVKNKLGNIIKHLDNIVEYSSSNDQLQPTLQVARQEVSNLKKHTAMAQHLLLVESDTISSSHPITSTYHTTANEFERTNSNHQTKVTPKDTVLANVEEKHERLSFLAQRLLRSFLLYPVDSEIKKTTLMYSLGASPIIWDEDDVEHCLRELVMEGFIIPVYRNHKPWSVKNCKLHPYVYHALVRKCFMASELVGRSPNDDIPSACFSGLPCLPWERKAQQILEIWGAPCINTRSHLLKFEKNRFLEARDCQIVQLGRWLNSARYHIEVENTEFLEWLRHFKHLRYLSLRGISRIKELPPSIGKLTHLTILDLRSCHNLESLPVEITMLRNLVHLDVSGCYLLDHMPKGIDSLQKLKVLKGFVIGNSGSQDPCQLYELRGLMYLRKLSIYIGREFEVEQREFTILESLEALRSLTITWGVTMSYDQVPNPMLDQTTVYISPPPMLTKLDLRCFPQTTVPNWLDPSRLPNLKYLYIRGGIMKLQGLLDKQWEGVEILRLRFLGDLNADGSELLNAFPFLDVLDIHECNSSTFKNRRFL